MVFGARTVAEAKSRPSIWSKKGRGLMMGQLKVIASHQDQRKRGHRGDWMQRGPGQGGRRRGDGGQERQIPKR